MPERLTQLPAKSEFLDKSVESSLLLPKEASQKPSRSFLTLYQYASFTDYILLSFGLVLTVAFSAIPVKLIVRIGDFIEIAGTYRFTLPKYYEEQHDTGENLLLLGFLTYSLCWVALYLSVVIGKNIASKWREAYIAAVMQKPISWHEKQQSGLIETIEKDLGLIQTACGEKILLIISALTFYLTCWIHSFTIHYGLTIVACVMIPFQLLAAFLLEKASVRNPTGAHRELDPEVAEIVENNIRYREENAQESVIEKYMQKINWYCTKTAAKGTLHGFGWAMFFVVLDSFSAGLFYMISQILLQQPDWWLGDYLITPKEAVMIFIATAMSSFYLGWIMPSIAHINAGMEAAARVDYIIKKNEAINGSRRLASVVGKIDFINVTFKGLKDVSFSVSAQENISILGASGTGKSAIGDLLTGAYSCDSGKVMVDGFDISEVNCSDLREFIVVVPQDPVIFDENFRENLTLGRNAGQDEIESATKTVGVHEFIMKNGGYDACMPETSALVKHQISLARALIVKPKILIIDDLLSTLPNLPFDNTSYHMEIAQTISKIIQSQTSILLTSSPSLASISEKLFVLQNDSLQDYSSIDEALKNSTVKFLKTSEKNLSEVYNFNETQDKPKTISSCQALWTIIKMESYFWHWLIIAGAGGVVAGITFPMFGYFFADNVATLLYLHGAFDKDQIKEDMIDRIIETILILIALTVLCFGLGRAAGSHTRKLRGQVIRSLLTCPSERLENSEYSKNKIQELLCEDCENAGNFIGAIFGIIILVCAAIGGALNYSFDADRTLAYIALSIVPFIILSSLATEMIIASSIFSCPSSGFKHMDNIRAIHQYNKQYYYQEKYLGNYQEAEKNMNYLSYINTTLISCKFLVMFSFWGIIALYSASNIKDGDLALDDMFIICFCVMFCYWSFLVADALMPNVYKSLESTKRVLKVIYEADEEGKKESQEITGQVEFRNVNFRYPKSHHYSFLNMSFTLQTNSVLNILNNDIAIADILLRHHTNFSGDILLDNKPLGTYKISHLRDNILYVNTKPIIFVSGIYDLLNPTGKYAHSDIEKVVEKYNIHDINDLTRTEYWKGVAKARIELKKPKIVIADENCGIEPGDYSLIVLGQKGLGQGQVIITCQGVCVQQGSHEELLKSSGSLYKDLYQAN